MEVGVTRALSIVAVTEIEPVGDGDGLRVRIQMPADSLGLKVAVSKR